MSAVKHFGLAVCLWLGLSVLKASPAIVHDFGQTALGSVTSATVTIPAAGSRSDGSMATCRLHYAVDFSAGACTAGSAGYTLTVRFSPKYPGLRQDAVVIKDSSGGVIAEAFLHGLGLGPVATFDPGLIKTILSPANHGGNSYSPWGIVADTATGFVYVSDRTENVVFRVDPRTGNKSIYAGVANSDFLTGNTGDGGPATSAHIVPGALALDGAGNLYIASGGGVIKKVDSETGIITTVAGGGSDMQGDGGPATNVLFNSICGVDVDADGDIYVCEQYGRRIRKIDAATGIIQTVAGSLVWQAQYGDGGPATDALLVEPSGITLDSAGNLYIADYGAATVRKVDAQTHIITTVAGMPFQRSVSAGIVNSQPATFVRLYNPAALAADAAGNLYIGDAGFVRRVNATTGLLDTIAGGNSPLINLAAITPLDGYPADVEGISGGYFGMDGAGNLFASNIEIERDKGALFFGPTAVGQTSSGQTVIVGNGGNQPLLVSNFASDSNFRKVSSGSTDCSDSPAIPAGGNCTVPIAFQPSTDGPITGALTVTDNSLNTSNARQAVTLRGPWSEALVSTKEADFGSQYVGESPSPISVFISNPGDVAVTVSLALAGTNASDFDIENDLSCRPSIDPQSQCAFWVIFRPQATGSRAGRVIITDSADASPQQIALTGIGVAPPPPQLSLSATSISFDDPQWRFGGWQLINLTSAGRTPLRLQSISLARGGNSGFAITPNCPLGSETELILTCSVFVYFNPLPGVEHYQDAMVIADDAPDSPRIVPLSGSNTSEALQFVPMTPCRVLDTRNATGPFGGPMLASRTTRTFNIPASSCGIPANAAAYSLNVTVVPSGALGYLTIWPWGAPQPLVSTLNSDGRVKANAAIVPAGVNGWVNVYVTDPTHLVLDINGYFVPAASSSALAFFPVHPCRMADTRLGIDPLGGPYLHGGAARAFPLLSSSCEIPSSARAYSLNITAVPHGPLGYLTAWPTGQSRPLVSTLNAQTAQVTANAAIVQAGTDGKISLYATEDTDIVIDANGYFAPAQSGGLSLYPSLPCRTLDTRNPLGSPPFQWTLPVDISAGKCAIPATAEAYVLNATVVPSGPLGYLSLWPDGQPQPLVSTLNAFDGSVTSNMAIVPTTNGAVDVFATDPTHLVVDVSGYFAP